LLIIIVDTHARSCNNLEEGSAMYIEIIKTLEKQTVKCISNTWIWRHRAIMRSSVFLTRYARLYNLRKHIFREPGSLV